MPVTGVILDYGCVVSLAPTLDDFEPLRKAIGVGEPTAFQKVYWRHRDAYDLDTLDVLGYWSAIGREVGATFTPEQVQSFTVMDRHVWGRPNPVIVEWTRILRERGLKTAIISNLSRNFSRYLRNSASWVGLFDHLCFSGELGIAKPDAGIFEGCLATLQLPAADAIFLDDREVNVKAARDLGMKGITFTSVEQLQSDLEPYGLSETLLQARSRTR